MSTDIIVTVESDRALALIHHRGLVDTDNPLDVLELLDLDDQPAHEILRRARIAMVDRASHWTPTAAVRMDLLRLAEYRRTVHAYRLLHVHGPEILDALHRGGRISQFIAETPYPEEGELDWAALFARDLIIRAEEERGTYPVVTVEMVESQISACKLLGHSLWGYRLQGLEPFELGEMLPELLSLPEVACKGYPADLSAFAIQWRFARWASKGRTTYATIRAVSEKERQTWEAGPPPLFLVTINGPAWLVMTEHERMFVLHHELQHGEVDLIGDPEVDGDCTLIMKPGTRGHDTEVMGATWARFGALNFTEAFAIKRAWENPRTRDLLAQAAEHAIQDPFDLERQMVEAEAEDLDTDEHRQVEGGDPFGGE